MSDRFTKDEAMTKIGKQVRILVDLQHIPVTAGTTGEVISLLSMMEGYDLLIRFHGTVGDVPILDYFNKDEYENFFEELDAVE